MNKSVEEQALAKDKDRLLKLYSDLIARLNPSCEDLHHNKNELHTSGPCPVMIKFKDILDWEVE